MSELVESLEAEVKRLWRGRDRAEAERDQLRREHEEILNLHYSFVGQDKQVLIDRMVQVSRRALSLGEEEGQVSQQDLVRAIDAEGKLIDAEGKLVRVTAQHRKLLHAMEALWYRYHDLLDHRAILDRCEEENCVAARAAIRASRLEASLVAMSEP